MKGFLRIVTGDLVKEEHYYSTKTEARRLTKKVTGTFTFIPILHESLGEEIPGSYDSEKIDQIFKRCNIIKHDTGISTTQNQYKKQAGRCETCTWSISVVYRIDGIVFSSLLQKINY